MTSAGGVHFEPTLRGEFGFNAINHAFDPGERVGGGVTINPGVSIGAGSVIGSGSVLTRPIASGVAATGVPCRVLRDVSG